MEAHHEVKRSFSDSGCLGRGISSNSSASWSAAVIVSTSCARSDDEDLHAQDARRFSTVALVVLWVHVAGTSLLGVPEFCTPPLTSVPILNSSDLSLMPKKTPSENLSVICTFFLDILAHADGVALG